jgi:hypothetical protein
MKVIRQAHVKEEEKKKRNVCNTGEQAQQWEQDSIEWQAAAEKVSMRTYQNCIDILEGLVVALI